MSWLRDLRYSARALSRTPGFSAAVVATLALGIGANTAVFSAIDAVLLQPLPFPNADRLMRLRQTQEATAETNIAPLRLEDWNRLGTAFESITGYYTEDVSETSGDLPEKVKRAFVAPRFVDVWGVAPALGRGFSTADHLANGAGVVLISDRYWQRRLGGQQDVLGNKVRIESGSYTIVGVMPASFRFPDRDVDMWFPVAMDSRYAQSQAVDLVSGHWPAQTRRHTRTGPCQPGSGAGEAWRAIPGERRQAEASRSPR